MAALRPDGPAPTTRTSYSITSRGSRRVPEPEGPGTRRSGRRLCPLSRTRRRRFRSGRGW
ncbi:hypothetical protein D9621_16940 [Azospirillum brasilense]|nr:hypothetical protein D9621_16940 [Azospirillum brasilense]